MDKTNSKWVLGVGFGLAFLASAVNASFIIQVGASVSHLTGDLSRLAIQLTTDDGLHGASFVHVQSALVGFLVGAILAGVFLHHPTVEPSQPYGKSISVIGLTLLLASLSLEQHETLAIALAGFACGFQNALATHFRGTVLRTTHVTGLLTDLGVVFGMRLRGHKIATWRILVPLCLVLGFLIGSGVGAILTASFGIEGVTWLLGWVYLTAGLTWVVLKHVVFPYRSQRR